MTKFTLKTIQGLGSTSMLLLLAGKKVIYYYCYRSDNGQLLHLRYKPEISQLGEDVVVEMWLMSKCDMLIHSLSNVS